MIRTYVRGWRAELSVLKSAIHEWAIEDLETLSNDELGDQLVELDAVIDQLELQRARRLDRFNRRKGFSHDGYPSATAFLVHRCRMAPGRATRLVAQSRSLSDMPETGGPGPMSGSPLTRLGI